MNSNNDESPEYIEALGIVQSGKFTKENYQRLVYLARKAENFEVGSMLEAFEAAAPNIDYLDLTDDDEDEIDDQAP